MKNLIRKILKESEWFEELDLRPIEYIHNQLREARIQKAGSRHWPQSRWNGWTRYVDKKGKLLFLENSEESEVKLGAKRKMLYFSRSINDSLENMNLNYESIKKICLDAFREIYGLEFDDAQLDYF